MTPKKSTLSSRIPAGALQSYRNFVTTKMPGSMQTLKNHPYIPSGVKEYIPSGVKEYIPSGVKKVFGFKKGGKTTTLHSITKSSKKSNW